MKYFTVPYKFDLEPNQISYFRFLQVSTGTGIVSYLVHLHIAVPEAFILGNGEYHIEQGSTINLVCVIEKVSDPWCHFKS